jgi:hypothetical protein
VLGGRQGAARWQTRTRATRPSKGDCVPPPGAYRSGQPEAAEAAFTPAVREVAASLRATRETLTGLPRAGHEAPASEPRTAASRELAGAEPAHRTCLASRCRARHQRTRETRVRPVASWRVPATNPNAPSRGCPATSRPDQVPGGTARSSGTPPGHLVLRPWTCHPAISDLARRMNSRTRTACIEEEPCRTTLKQSRRDQGQSPSRKARSSGRPVRQTSSQALTFRDLSARVLPGHG